MSQHRELREPPAERDPGQGGGDLARRKDLAGARPHRQPGAAVRLAGGDPDPQDGGAMSAAATPVAWRRDSELPFQKLDEETIVVDPRRREVHLLNETAARIWELLASPRSLDELTATLGDEYDVAEAELREAVVECVDGLSSKGLLVARWGALARWPRPRARSRSPSPRRRRAARTSIVVGAEAQLRADQPGAGQGGRAHRAAQRVAGADAQLQHPLPALLQPRSRRAPAAPRAAAAARRRRQQPELSLDEILRLLADLRDGRLPDPGADRRRGAHLPSPVRGARSRARAQLRGAAADQRHDAAARGRRRGWRATATCSGVSISLYGATADVHDGITQMRGLVPADLGRRAAAARGRRSPCGSSSSSCGRTRTRWRRCAPRRRRAASRTWSTSRSPRATTARAAAWRRA